MAIVGGFAVHRRQVTFDHLDTVTGQVRRGRITPACRETRRHWLERFAGCDDTTFAGGGLHGVAVRGRGAAAGGGHRGAGRAGRERGTGAAPSAAPRPARRTPGSCAPWRPRARCRCPWIPRSRSASCGRCCRPARLQGAGQRTVRGRAAGRGDHLGVLTGSKTGCRVLCRPACCSYASTPAAIGYGPRIRWSCGETCW